MKVHRDWNDNPELMKFVAAALHQAEQDVPQSVRKVKFVDPDALEHLRIALTSTFDGERKRYFALELVEVL